MFSYSQVTFENKELLTASVYYLEYCQLHLIVDTFSIHNKLLLIRAVY